MTTLVENTASGPNLLGEPGLSLRMGSPPQNILFDTGPGMILEHNSRQLGIDLGKTDAIAISHGHGDH